MSGPPERVGGCAKSSPYNVTSRDTPRLRFDSRPDPIAQRAASHEIDAHAESVLEEELLTRHGKSNERVHDAPRRSYRMRSWSLFGSRVQNSIDCGTRRKPVQNGGRETVAPSNRSRASRTR